MYLRKAPVVFVKDGERRTVYHSVTADELLAEGWTVEGAEEAPVKEEEPTAQEEPVAQEEEVVAEQKEEKLEEMTKSQLLEWAAVNHVNVTPYASKAEMLATCRESQNG